MSSKFDTERFDIFEELGLQEVREEVRQEVGGEGRREGNAEKQPTTERPAALPPSRKEMSDRFEHARDDEAGRESGSESGRQTLATPLVDIAESDEVVLFVVDLPGMNEKDVDVVISRDLLTIRSKAVAADPSITAWHLRERNASGVERLILIPEGVDTDDASMQFRNGVLTVRMAKSLRHLRRRPVLAS